MVIILSVSSLLQQPDSCQRSNTIVYYDYICNPVNLLTLPVFSLQINYIMTAVCFSFE